MKSPAALSALAMLVGTASGAEQMIDAISGVAVSCAQEAVLVNEACCATLSDCVSGVPRTCPTTGCATRYLSFYHQCSAIIRPIEEMMPNAAPFTELYQSCVEREGHRDTSGHVVDDTVQQSTLYDFRTRGASTSGWRVTVDGVMGGRSHGTFAQDDTQSCAVLSGTIELTHGGFVNVRGPTITPVHGLEGMDGIRICSKATADYGVQDGVGDLYKLTLEDGSRSSWRADFHTNEVTAADASPTDDCDGVVSTVPFAQFYPSHWGQITGPQGSIDAASIESVGLDVSFQTEDGGANAELDHDACAHHSSSCQNLNPFGICVQWIQGYTNKDAAAAGGGH